MPAGRAARRDWVNNSTMPRKKAAPTLKPVAREVLDQIRKDRRSAGMVKKHYLRQVEAATHDYLVNVRGPCESGCVA